MGNVRRKDLLRKADAAANAQERSAKQLLALYNVYERNYAEEAAIVEAIAMSALELRDNIIRFRKERM